MPLESPQPSPSPFVGHVVVFTGKLSSLGRREARDLVERLGGSAADDVTARTTILVVGAEGIGPARRRMGTPGEFEIDDESRKLRKAEQVNARTPGQVSILSEDDFCRRAGLAAPGDLRQQFHAARDIQTMYPSVDEAHLRYLDKWGLIRSVVVTNAQRYYGFADLTVVKQVHGDLETGKPFRAVVRDLIAARQGQLAFDFHSGRSDAQPARVVALERRASSSAAPPLRVRGGVADPQAALAAKYFLEGAALDEPDVGADRQEQAAAAYRKALVVDPELVPAIVNLANIHYARDELIEAEVLYERAMTLDTECFEAHFNLGNIHHDLGRFVDAVACYREALALNPRYADAHFYLAVTLEKLGQSIEAKPHWKAYQRLAPDGEWVELAKEFSE